LADANKPKEIPKISKREFSDVLFGGEDWGFRVVTGEYIAILGISKLRGL